MITCVQNNIDNTTGKMPWKKKLGFERDSIRFVTILVLIVIHDSVSHESLTDRIQGIFPVVLWLHSHLLLFHYMI